MNTGNTKFAVNRIATPLLVSFWLAGCTSTNNPPAPVSSAGDVASSSTNSDILITPPSSGARSAPQAQLIQPVQTQTIQPQPTPMAQEPMQTVNGKTVYDHKYGSIPKGSYTGDSTYMIKYGDTLFYIVQVVGNNFHDLAQRSNVPAPYVLNVGQALQIGSTSGQPITGENAVSQASAKTNGSATAITTSAQKLTVMAVSQPTITYSEFSGGQSATRMLPDNRPTTTTATVVVPVAAPTTVSTTQPAAGNVSTSSSILSWRWPANDKAIENSSGAEGGNKGINIAGSKGQTTVATADERTVYAGNTLRGYGNLIIIKHNDDYLGAYAHNDAMLVREQQEVRAGQKIITMDSAGTSSARLHFGICYKGKSVNPLQCLPQRQFGKVWINETSTDRRQGGVYVPLAERAGGIVQAPLVDMS